MLAVSNTSPLSNLASIGRLDLLKAQFSVLWIPTSVERELKAHPSPLAAATIESAVRDQAVRVGVAQDTPFKRMLLQQLHQGEAEAIALASDLKANILIIDEQEGRALATQAGLSLTGTLGILLKAERLGQISSIEPEIRVLRERARFFLSASLEARVLAAAGEA